MHEYEFMGPILGPLGITLGLPLVCYVLGAATGPIDLMVVPSTLMELALQGRMFSWQGLAVVLAWFCILVALHLVIPGQKVMGVVLDDGSRLQYKLNGVELGYWLLYILDHGHDSKSNCTDGKGSLADRLRWARCCVCF